MLGVCEAFWAVRNTQHLRNETVHAMSDWFALLRVLFSLADADATLSYFIEPGSGQIGWKDKYRYASHGLRFDVNKPGESRDEFEKRINVSVRDEGEGKTSRGSGDWFLGVNNRNVCSIHSDYKYASAIELSDIEFVAVYPVIGCWRSCKYLGRIDSEARYSLIVSIETPGMETDLYSEITQVIESTSATAVPITVPAYSKRVSRNLDHTDIVKNRFLSSR